MALPMPPPTPTQPSRRRNPNWTRDETILLLDLYMRVPNAGRSHPGVLALSLELNLLARARGADMLPTFRNTSGISMRLRNISRQDPSASFSEATGLRSGGAIDALVWKEFAGRPKALAEEVARIRGRSAEAERARSSRSSHGPGPYVGTVSAERSDGETLIYILRLAGPLDHLLPKLRLSEDFLIVKIGRSNNVARRIVELSSGFPPGAALRFELLWTRRCNSVVDAHSAERALLDHCDIVGWSLGGEFACAPLAPLLQAASRIVSPFANGGHDDQEVPLDPAPVRFRSRGSGF